MKTPEFYLDEAVRVKSEYSKNFKDLMLKYKQGDCVRVFIESVVEEAMIRFATDACKEQRGICAEKATAHAVYSSDNDGSYDGVVNIGSILNATSPIKD